MVRAQSTAAIGAAASASGGKAVGDSPQAWVRPPLPTPQPQPAPPPTGAEALRVLDADPFPHSDNDLGVVGLLQMPTARMYPDGQFEVGANFLTPHQRYYLSWTILPWLETTFRYTDTRGTALNSGGVTNGRAASTGRFLSDIFSGTLASALDRGLDLKFKLASETDRSPQIVLGLQDVVGTGLFQGEYIAASKRFYDLDLTIGVGWGYFAGRGIARNPFSQISSHFKTRGRVSNQGGQPSLQTLFAGRDIGLFGGIEYWLPWQRTVSLKLEYNSADPSLTPLVHVRRGFPVDVGVNWRPFGWLDLGAGFERGNALMLKAAARTNLHTAHPPMIIDLPPDPVQPREQVARSLPVLPGTPAPAQTASAAAPPPSRAAAVSAGGTPPVRDVFRALDNQGVRIRAMRLQGGAVVVEAEIPSNPHGDPDLAAARTIAESWPDPGQTVILVGERHGMPVSRVVVRPSGRPARRLSPALAGRSMPPTLYAPAKPGRPRPVLAYDTAAIAHQVFADLADRGFLADALRMSGGQATVWVRQLKYAETPQNVGRVARVVANDVPPEIESITVVLMPDGLEIARATLLRSDLERIGTVPAEVILRDADIRGPGEGEGDSLRVPPSAIRNPKAYPKFAWSLGPVLRSNIGSRQGLYLFDIEAEAYGRLAIARGLSLQGTFDRKIWGNLNQLKVSTASHLPHVRTYLPLYLKEGRNFSIPNLQADYLVNLAPNTFGRLSAGLFEPMYGGVDAEVLYKPFNWPVAFGLEANWVRQRGFKQLFSFRNYSVVTGHASVYWELPFYGITAALHAGRYLAKDVGATFELSRRFASGVRVGVFVTKTNVSAAKFGEGSFDKGFYMVFPFNLFSFTPTRAAGTFLFRPITRDGGAMVGVGPKLYDVVTGDGREQFDAFWPTLVY